MKCDCCGKEYEIMYRTIDTRVYCLDCSRRTTLCCYGKSVVPSKWFRVAKSERWLKSLEKRGYVRTFKDGCNPLLITRVRDGSRKEARRPKYQSKVALNFHRSLKRRKK